MPAAADAALALLATQSDRARVQLASIDADDPGTFTTPSARAAARDTARAAVVASGCEASVVGCEKVSDFAGSR